jgi:hypothetical protein
MFSCALAAPALTMSLAILWRLSIRKTELDAAGNHSAGNHITMQRDGSIGGFDGALADCGAAVGLPLRTGHSTDICLSRSSLCSR